MAKPTFISDDEIRELLDWDTLVPALEKAMGDLSRKKVIQPSRLFMRLPPKNAALLAMPAFNENENTLGCKVVTSFPNNEKQGLPSVLATILFMDSETGKVKVIMEGTEITTWRTAGTSVVATKNLHQGEKKVLAILGAGVQGRIHAMAMKHYFNFAEVRIWNRNKQKAEKLCEELGPWAVLYTSNEECVKGADVIVTATYSSTPVVMKDWVKEGAHINAVGTESDHHGELDEKLYKCKSTSLFADHKEAVSDELKDLVADGVDVVAEIGQIINKSVSIPKGTRVTVFQSLGMAIEDVTAAKLIYESYTKKKMLQ